MSDPTTSDPSVNPFQVAPTGVPAPQLPSDQPGMLGVSPSTWQNISNLGAGMIAGANARTGDGHLANGTGFAGGFGAGVSAFNNSVNNQAQMRSQIGAQQAATQGQTLQNQMAATQVPLAQMKAKFQQALYSNPDLMKQMTGIDFGGSAGGGTPPAGQPAAAGGQPAAAGGSYAGTVNGPLEGGAGQNPNSSASGYGQLIDENKQKFAAANPSYFTGVDLKNPQAVNARFQVPEVGTAATNWLAAQNAPVLTNAGVPATGPNLAVAHRLGAGAAVGVLKAPDTLPLPQALVQTVGMQEATKVLKANPDMANQTVGGFKQQFANVPAYGPAAGVQPGAEAPGLSGQSLVSHAGQLLTQAGQLEQRQAFSKSMGLPGPPGDPTALRTQAQQERETGLKMMSAGPVAGAAQQAQKDVDLKMNPQIERETTISHSIQPTMDRFGNLYTLKQSGPQRGEIQYQGRGSEVKPFIDPTTGREYPGEAGGLGVGDPKNVPGYNAAAAGGAPAAPAPAPAGQTVPGQAPAPAGIPSPGSGQPIMKLGPGEIEGMKNVPEIAKNFIEHDHEMVDHDLGQVISDVTPAKQQLFQLRTLNDQNNVTGAAAELRMGIKSWFNTFLPGVSKDQDIDASPMQEINKIGTMGAGKAERGDNGARGGVRLMEMYVKANPGIDASPKANHDMANALLVSHQFHEDYAQGATNHFQTQWSKVQTAGTTSGYQPVNAYDAQFNKVMRPELYAKAIDAMNGKPSTQWAAGLTAKQKQLVGGIVQRTDPTSVIDVEGRRIPASSFTTTFGPTDIPVPTAGKP